MPTDHLGRPLRRDQSNAYFHAKYGVFTDQDGKIVAHTDLGMIGRQIERASGLALAMADVQVQPYTDPKDGTLIDFAVPLVFSQVRVGALYLGFSRRTIEQALAQARNRTLLMSAAMVLVGIIGAVGLAHVISGPVLRLVDGTRAIAAGNFQIVLPVPSRVCSTLALNRF